MKAAEILTVSCPVCGIEHHLLHIQQHIAEQHKFVSRMHCHRICMERLALYRRVTGEDLTLPPLNSVERTMGARACETSITATPSQQQEANDRVFDKSEGGANTTSPNCESEEEGFEEAPGCQPAAEEDDQQKECWSNKLDVSSLQYFDPLRGLYVCPVCPVCGGFRTRDSLLSHLYDSHEGEFDAEAAEPWIPSKRAVVPQHPDIDVPEYIPPPEPISLVEPSSVSSKNNRKRKKKKKKGASLAVSAEADVTYIPEGASEADLFPCEMCSKVFSTELELLTHLEQHENGDIASETEPVKTVEVDSTPRATVGVTAAKCTLCNSPRLFLSQDALYDHVQCKHSEVEDPHKEAREMWAIRAEAHICPICDKHFGLATALMEHMLGKHRTNCKVGESSEKRKPQGKFLCLDCGELQMNAALLHDHLKKNHDRQFRPFPCPVCPRMFTDITGIETHVSLMHKNIDMKEVYSLYTFSCSHCEIMFVTSDDLKKHIELDHKDR